MTARVVFMGSPGFAVPSLTALAERPDLCEVVAVWTQPDRPAGRGHKLTPPPVKVAAMARGIPVFQPSKMKTPETQQALAALRPDLAVVAAYGRILPRALLETPRLGCINVHASLLPRHRGASPINHAIAAGDTHTGVSIMQLEEGLDTGPVFAMRETPIGATEDTGALTVRLATLGAELLVATLPRILSGELVAQPQDHASATYAPLLTKAHGHLDFARDAPTVERLVRAMQPWPSARCEAESGVVQVLRARVDEGTGAAGQVLEAGAQGVLVACGGGALRLLEVKPAGKGAMAASAWAAGRGVTVGERLAAPSGG